MALPKFADFLLPTLRAFADGAEHVKSDAVDAVGRALELSEEDKLLTLNDGRTPVYASRTIWAITYLYRAGALERTRRGVYKISDRGRELLNRHKDSLTIQDLRQYPEFREFQQVRRVVEDSEKDISDWNEESTPTERLEQAYRELREALAADLLDRVSRMDPQRFERLVVDLLLAMGYGGAVDDAGTVVGRSGDAGIDGTIKEDKLGLDVVYIQAKRWQQNIGRPELQAFVGALEGARARKGVFITTSDFTKDARDYVKTIERRIVLIDGHQLAEYMIDHDVGVSTVQRYQLKRVDSDYFESE
jgi:restriction system protein